MLTTPGQYGSIVIFVISFNIFLYPEFSFKKGKILRGKELPIHTKKSEILEGNI